MRVAIRSRDDYRPRREIHCLLLLVHKQTTMMMMMTCWEMLLLLLWSKKAARAIMTQDLPPPDRRESGRAGCQVVGEREGSLRKRFSETYSPQSVEISEVGGLIPNTDGGGQHADKAAALP